MGFFIIYLFILLNCLSLVVQETERNQIKLLKVPKVKKNNKFFSFFFISCAPKEALG